MTAEREGLADLLAEHFPNVVTEGSGDMCRTRVKCDGYGCGFYAEADGTARDWAGYGAATDAHRAHLADALADLLAARDRRVRGEALREAAEEMPFGYTHAAHLLRDRADRIEAEG